MLKESNGTPGYRQGCTYYAACQMETLTTFGSQTAATRREYDLDRRWRPPPCGGVEFVQKSVALRQFPQQVPCETSPSGAIS